MADRHRELTVQDHDETYAQVAKYSSGLGSCTVDVGEVNTAYSAWSVSGSQKTKYEFREMDDVVTPNFHREKSKGNIINNPMISSYEQSLIPNAPVSMEYMLQRHGCDPSRWYNYRKFEVTGDRSMSSVLGSSLFIPAPSIDTTSMAAQATTKAWANIGQSEMLFGASLGELDQTVDGLGYILKKVHRIAKAYRKAQLRELAHELSPRELAEIYLNVRYNLRPLMYDVIGMTKVLNAPIRKAMRQTYRGNLTRTEIDSDQIEADLVKDSMRDFHATFSRHVSRTVESRAGVLTSVEAINASQLLGGTDFLETMWDLRPYTFILDWFINAGDVVSSFAPNVGTKALASWLVEVDTTIYTTTIVGSDFDCVNNATYNHSGLNSNYGPGTATRIIKTIKRTPDYSRPILPSWKVNLNPLKLLDLGLIVGDLKNFRFSKA